MTGRAFVAAALVAALASLPALAQEERSKSQDYSTKKICKLDDRIGSRLGAKRNCRTKAEWDQIRAESRQVAEHIQAGTAPCLVGTNQPGNAHLSCSN